MCYNPIQDTIDVSFDEREKETLAEIMATQKIEDLLLEIKDDDEEFEVYHPGCKFCQSSLSDSYVHMCKKLHCIQNACK